MRGMSDRRRRSLSAGAREGEAKLAERQADKEALTFALAQLGGTFLRPEANAKAERARAILRRLIENPEIVGA